MLVVLVRKYDRVLVTGGAGFIGSHIVDRLMADGCEVRVLDNLSTGKLSNIKKHVGSRRFRFIKGDITDQSMLRKALNGIEIVFHEAAQVNITASVRDPLPTNDVNTTGTLRLLKTSTDKGVRRFIYASSSSIYGETGEQPVKEDAAQQPVSPYAVSKLAAEKYCLCFDHLGKLDAVALRYFNVYGPRQGYGPYSGVMTAFLERLRRNQPLIIHGDGEQTRDFVNVQDVVQANILAMTTEKAAGEAFNIGTGQRTSVNKLAEMVIEASGKKDLTPTHASARSGDVRHSCADIEKARRVLGYSPNVTLRSYISEVTRERKPSKRLTF
ncbi:SDR family NAD(P)-dependent oxidoreductase [Candidatus Bathyarchaeota archaeon]|nr:SDR family NAD(P)-dependent oxidoreductase [Candidatus Bathyarchaeota archaeon]